MDRNCILSSYEQKEGEKCVQWLCSHLQEAISTERIEGGFIVLRHCNLTTTAYELNDMFDRITENERDYIKDCATEWIVKEAKEGRLTNPAHWKTTRDFETYYDINVTYRYVFCYSHEYVFMIRLENHLCNDATHGHAENVPVQICQFEISLYGWIDDNACRMHTLWEENIPIHLEKPIEVMADDWTPVPSRYSHMDRCGCRLEKRYM